MLIYHPDLQAIDQQTRQLENERCKHCHRAQQLVSHGFVYKKCGVGMVPKAVGKRVFCSNRNQHTGCGRTVQLYLDLTVRYLHYTGRDLLAFILEVLNGMTVQQAYCQATGTTEVRHAYRWLGRLEAQLSSYRSVIHQSAVLVDAMSVDRQRRPRLNLLDSTLRCLLHQFGEPLCANYQGTLQRSFLPLALSAA